MDITYNNLYTPSNVLTFSDVPNILKLEETITGDKGSFSFIFSGNLQSTVSADSQYSVTFLDETVTNVMNPKNAKNKRFYISSDPKSTAVSFAQALRSCPSLVAQFNVVYNDNTVELQGITYGQKWSNIAHYLDSNIPSNYMTTRAFDGSAYPEDVFQAKVLVDVSNADGYVTTLEKTFYGNECGFDVSPVLSTFSEYGKTKSYSFTIGTISQSGEYSKRGTMSGYTTCGYMANQSDKFKYLDACEVALNTNRNQVRYIYGTRISYSLLIGNASSEYTITYSLKNSTLTEIYSATETIATAGYSSHIIDKSWTFPYTYLNLISYLDISVSGKTVRFKILKPLKAAEGYQRVYWRNEYGGIEFFDFTGQRSETDSVDIETYEKNIYDMYDNSEYEIKKIYSNNYGKSVKLTSHLMEENGKWFTNSLMRSKRVWTVINEKTHYIIPKSVEVSEDGTYNNIYTVSLTYEYSQLS